MQVFSNEKGLTMTNRVKSTIEAAKQQILKEYAERAEDAGNQGPREVKTYGVLEDRLERVKELVNGDRFTAALYRVDPARCRMWAHHNRRYDLLNEACCADLIEGFRAMGKQEFPTIVREVRDDPNYDYEVVCGARRHWTASYLGWRLLIEVRELTDEEAFRLSDVENRDRKDISDYERACDYKEALQRYYLSQKQMATRLEVSEPWLSRYLDLAELPKEIVEAYGDITEIKVQHARELKPLLKDKAARELVLAKAREAVTEQQAVCEGSRQLMSGTQVLKTLMNAARQRRVKKDGPLAEYQAKATGKTFMVVDRKGRIDLLLTICSASGASKEEILNACRQTLDTFLN
jgi:ParB family transcriptional regulator, chromosome partitioning protein